MSKSAQFRFYEELNDFLPAAKKKSWIPYDFTGKPTVKDAIESLGVPHTEIDLILANSCSVDFSYHLRNGDTVSVYPVFESLDISEVTHLRAKPLRKPKFILDVHLGKLAQYLRMLGFDTLYENNYDDSTIVALSKAEKRTILTRDVNLLKCKTITHGFWIRTQHAKEQLTEVIHRFDLFLKIKSLTRCMVCNGIIHKVKKESVIHRLQPKTKQYYDEFHQCVSCEKVYWKGSHYSKIKKFIEDIQDKVSKAADDRTS